MEGYGKEMCTVKQGHYTEDNRANSVQTGEISTVYSAMSEFIEAVKWHNECVQLAKRLSPCSGEAEAEIGLLTFCALGELERARSLLKLLLDFE